jgi:RimJ/RimL family protein N-acetyltransferase
MSGGIPVDGNGHHHPTRRAAHNPTEYGGWWLRSVQPSDLPMLYEWVMDARVNHRWTTRGTLVPYDAFAAKVWEDAVVNVLVVSGNGAQPVSWATVSSVDLHSGYASGAVVVDPSQPTTAGVGPRTVFLLLRYVFAVYPLRKIYFESPEYAAHDFRTALGTLMQVEGRLVEHLYYHGEYWDKYILAVTARSWAERGSELLARFFPRPLAPEGSAIAAAPIGAQGGQRP